MKVKIGKRIGFARQQKAASVRHRAEPISRAGALGPSNQVVGKRMRLENALKDFIGALKIRLGAHERTWQGLKKRVSIAGDDDTRELLKAIPEAHISELEYVIEELERILKSI
jgi:hypothetical protein